MIECEIIQGQENIFQYKNIWNKLFDSGKCEPSTSFEWTYALLSTSLKNTDNFQLMILKDSDKIVGIVPLVFSESKKGGLRLVHLFPISEYANTHSDILLNNLSSELIKVFISALFEMNYKWDVFRIGRVIETNPLLVYMQHYLNENSIKYKIRMNEPSFFITLASDYSEYLKKRSGKLRNYLKRMEKKLKAKGHIDVFRLENYGSVADAYNQLLSVEKKSWKHNHGTAISSKKNQKDFYEILCKGASENGWLHLHFLYLNKKPIAYNMGLIKDNTYLYLKTSFNKEFRQFGPATILRGKLIEELINNNVRYFDFSAEPYEWERQWTDELRWHKSVLIFNNTIKAKLFSLYEAFKYKKSKSQFNNNQFKYHDPRDKKP